MSFQGWNAVVERLRERSDDHLNAGQYRALHAIAERLLGGHGNTCRGVVLADEVGMGKTRVACAVAKAVVASGGRVAITVPGGLGYQWSRELADDGQPGIELLRSFWGFLQAYDEGEPWDQQSLILLSHHLPNWRLRRDSQCGRWRLVPALVAEVRKQQTKRYPNDYGPMKRQWVGAAAGAILQAIDRSEQGRPAILDELAQWRWKDLDDPRLYLRGAELGTTLASAVGWGLGRFDLVVIDEAHKGKGDESMVNRLLQDIVHTRPRAARVALTATPVAMHVGEWSRTLKRIGLDDETLKSVDGHATRYAEATHQLRATWRTDVSRHTTWRSAARAFESALRPYVLRRDKREDPAVIAYSQRTGDTESYRRVQDLVLHTRQLPLAWRRVVVGSEALSATVSGVEDSLGKRLRLTLANGHGIAWLIGAAQDRARAAEEVGETTSKRLHRAKDWERLVLSGVGIESKLALLEHPQIRHAADFLDACLARGEKVLVFGRFSRPIQALSTLLNSRARVRAMVENSSWAQEEPWSGPDKHLHPEDCIAAGQLGISQRRVRSGFKRHKKRYIAEQTRRAWLYRNLLVMLSAGLEGEGAPAWAVPLLQAVTDADRALLGRAIWELLPERARRRARDKRRGRRLEQSLASAFVSLATAALDDDPFEPDDRERRDAGWATLRKYLQEEFSAQRSRTSRVLEGSTPPPTRRLLQAAFNRPQSEPRVLIAQSMVGREGLNLHEACRVVLLLHPEWNPGVVEQQIGRVDRIGSRWEKALKDCGAGVAVADLPRIEVHALVFEGTYDEHNWTVLKRRWADLRAQLHGVVISSSEVATQEERVVAEQLNALAPSFKP